MRSLLRKTLPLAVLATLAASTARAHQDAPGSAEDHSVAAVGADAIDPAIDRWVQRFKGTTLILDQSITPDTIAPGVQLSAVPSYQWWFSFRPRFYVTPNFSLRLRADLTVEALNGTDTTYAHQAMWGDTWLDGVYSGIPKFLGIESTVGWRFLLPTSLASQMRGVLFITGPTVGLNRDFSTRIGDFGLSLGLAGTYNVLSRTSGALRDNQVYGCQSIEGAPQLCGDNVSGAMDSAFQFVALLGAKYSPIPALTLNVNYVFIDQWAYAPSPTMGKDPTTGTTFNVDPSNVGSQPGSPADTRFRQYGWFITSLDYEVQKWVTLSLGFYTYRPILDPNSTYGNPFWEPGGATRIFFTIGLGLDQAFGALATRIKHSRIQPMQTASAAPAPLSPTFQ